MGGGKCDRGAGEKVVSALDLEQRKNRRNKRNVVMIKEK